MRQLQFGYVAVLLAGSIFAASAARAQFYQPRAGGNYPGGLGGGYPGGLGGVPGYGSPTVSPYVGSLQRGVSPAVAYYGFVRPTINLQNQALGFQADITRVYQSAMVKRAD